MKQKNGDGESKVSWAQAFTKSSRVLFWNVILCQFCVKKCHNAINEESKLPVLEIYRTSISSMSIRLCIGLLYPDPVPYQAANI